MTSKQREGTSLISISTSLVFNPFASYDRPALENLIISIQCEKWASISMFFYSFSYAAYSSSLLNFLLSFPPHLQRVKFPVSLHNKLKGLLRYFSCLLNLFNFRLCGCSLRTIPSPLLLSKLFGSFITLIYTYFSITFILLITFSPIAFFVGFLSFKSLSSHTYPSNSGYSYYFRSNVF